MKNLRMVLYGTLIVLLSLSSGCSTVMSQEDLDRATGASIAGALSHQWEWVLVGWLIGPDVMNGVFGRSKYEKYRDHDAYRSSSSPCKYALYQQEYYDERSDSIKIKFRRSKECKSYGADDNPPVYYDMNTVPYYRNR